MQNTLLDTEALKKSALKKSHRRENLAAMALISPYVIVFIVFALIPTVAGIVMSFMKYDPYDASVREFVGFNNYIALFDFTKATSKQFWSSFGTMLCFDLVAVPLLIIVPLFLAYFINMQPPGYKIFRAIIYLPSIVSVTVMGIVFGYIFKGDNSGLINAWFHTNVMWLYGKPWEGDILRWVVILIASLWWQTGTNFVIFAGALRNVPKSLGEACEMDGGGRLSVIRFVTLPSIRSSITICLFNTLIGYLGLYGQTYALCAPDNRSEMVSPMMFIQNFLMGGANYSVKTGFFCACAVVFGLIVMFISILDRVATADRRKKSRYAAQSEDFYREKALLDAASATVTCNTAERHEVYVSGEEE